MTRDEAQQIKPAFEQIFNLARQPLETANQGAFSEIRRICREMNIYLNGMVTE